MNLSGTAASLTVVALFSSCLLSACGGSETDDSSGASEPRPTVTVTATPTPEATDSVSEATEEPAEVTEPPLFPKGYPKVVSVSTLPDQVKSWYQMDGTKRAVAVAPGVWAPRTPGATAEDVATAGVLDGFCGSIKAYERKFTPGEEHGGTCW